MLGRVPLGPSVPLPDALDRFDASVKKQIMAQALRPVTEVMRDELYVLYGMAKARDATLVWNDFNGPKHADCSYFGIYQQPTDIQCTAENIEKYLLVEGIYNTCRQRLIQLTRHHSPDTFGWDQDAVSRAKGKRVELDDLVVETSPELGTYRGLNRFNWYQVVTAYVSLAHWSLGVRTGFLYATRVADNVVKDESLEMWGPAESTRILEAMWQGARNNNLELFLPLSMQSFASFSFDPGLNSPWVVQSKGWDRDSQQIAELKRGQQRRKRRRMSRSGKVGRQDWFDTRGVGGRVQVDKGKADEGWNRFLMKVVKGSDGHRILDEAAPDNAFLMRVFSVRGTQIHPLKNYTGGRGDSKVFVPSGDLLIDYVRGFANHIAKNQFLQMVGASWEIYITYLERFADVLEKYMGISLNDLADMKKKAQQLRTAKIGGSIAGVLTTIASAVVGAAPVGTIVGVVLYVVAGLVVLFTSLFGGRLMGCPKAPRMMMIKTFAGDNTCNVDITEDRAMDSAVRNTIQIAADVGIQLANPLPGAPPPPQQEGWEQEVPVLDSNVMIPKSPWMTYVVLGGVAIIGGAVVLRAVRD